MCPTDWQVLGSISPKELTGARLVLHHAVQLAAAPGQHLLPRRPDDGQMALTWEAGAMVGETLPSGHRVALHLEALLLELRGPGISVQLPLEGRSSEAALDWLRVELARAGVEARSLTLAMPYELPPLPLGAITFRASTGVTELAHWYADAAELLQGYTALPGASPLRCWPHHFDLATLLSLETIEAVPDPEQARSIGLGFSPGDEGISEPYFYVTPWPYPEAAKPPALPAGRWNRSPWFGAVLQASDLVRATDQPILASAFLRAAHQACKGLLLDISASAGSRE